MLLNGGSMKKEWLVKILALSIVVLFIATGFVSAFYINESKVIMDNHPPNVSQMVYKDNQPQKPLGPILGFWIVAGMDGYLKNVEEINYSSSKKIGKHYIYRDVELIGESEWYGGPDFGMPSLSIGWGFGNIVFWGPIGPIKLNVKLLINTGALGIKEGKLWFGAIGLWIKLKNLY
jgi:hypothetical protein